MDNIIPDLDASIIRANIEDGNRNDCYRVNGHAIYTSSTQTEYIHAIIIVRLVTSLSDDVVNMMLEYKDERLVTSRTMTPDEVMDLTDTMVLLKSNYMSDYKTLLNDVSILINNNKSINYYNNRIILILIISGISILNTLYFLLSIVINEADGIIWNSIMLAISTTSMFLAFNSLLTTTTYYNKLMNLVKDGYDNWKDNY